MIKIDRSQEPRHDTSAPVHQGRTSQEALPLRGARIAAFGAAVLYGAIAMCFFMAMLYFAFGLSEGAMCLAASLLMAGFAARFACEALRGVLSGVVVPWRRAGAPVLKADRPIAFGLSLANQILGLLITAPFAGFLALAALS